MKEYIKTFNNVLTKDEHKYLLKLCDEFEFSDLDSPDGKSCYHLSGNRYNERLQEKHGDIYELVHKAFVSTMPKVYDAYSKVLPDDLRYNYYSGYFLCKYVEGSYLSYHSDTDADAGSLTGSFSINDDYEGGNLIFWDDYKLEHKENSIHFYPSSLTHPHRVDEVTKGARYSVVVWFAYQKGDDWPEDFSENYEEDDD